VNEKEGERKKEREITHVAKEGIYLLAKLFMYAQACIYTVVESWHSSCVPNITIVDLKIHQSTHRSPPHLVSAGKGKRESA
jgi:hypothetical protein